jgi:hypothetical protein
MQTGYNAVVSHHAHLAKSCCTLPYRRPQMVGLTSPPPSSSYPPPKARKARLLHPTYMGPENNGLNMGPQPPHVWTLANTYSPMAIPQHTGPILGMTTNFFFARRLRIQVCDTDLDPRPQCHSIHPFALRELCRNAAYSGTRNYCIFAVASIASNYPPY